ncbi:MAG: hypothetical protein FWG68_05855 [Defluviitaleaceae bacterium]|nr:hypothetical protein [Defluviitaleaceae bacterium]
MSIFFVSFLVLSSSLCHSQMLMFSPFFPLRLPEWSSATTSVDMIIISQFWDRVKWFAIFFANPDSKNPILKFV